MYFQPTDVGGDGGDCSSLNPPYYVNYCQYAGAANVLNKVSILHFLDQINNLTFRPYLALNTLLQSLLRMETIN